MPTPRFGEIPKVRLSAARKVRDLIKSQIGNNGYALVSISKGAYSVCVRLYDGVRLREPIPHEIDGVPIKVGRVSKIYPKQNT